MRTSKIVALVAATALLVIGSAFAAMAVTTGWVEESGSWKYYDKNGDAVTEKFVKNGDNWYYLDSDEYMATDKLVEYNDNYYYVAEDGKMVTNAWKKVANTDGDDNYGEYIYYYFQSTGKAYKGATGAVAKTVNGKKYVFDENGKMRYGWLDSALNFVDNEEGKAYANSAIYYCGDPDDGARATSKWKKLRITDSDGDDVEKWFYFDNNGKKVTANKTINGKKYAFDTNGVMQAEWASVSTDNTASISKYAWFQDAENGAKLANGWFKVVPQASVNKDDNEAETVHWYWADKTGKLAKSAVKTINGKQYGFNEKGEMVAGLQYVKYDGTDYTFTAIDNDKAKVDDYFTAGKANVCDGKSGVRFFSDDEEKDGSMKTGSVKVVVDGEEYNCKFQTKGTSKGCGKTGKDGSYYYQNGCKVTADGELKVQAFPTDDWQTAGISAVKINGKALTATQAKDTYAGTYKAVVLTSSGVIVQNGTKTDSDGMKYTVKSYQLTKVEDTNK